MNVLVRKILLFFTVIAFINSTYSQDLYEVPIIKGTILCNKPQWAVFSWYGKNRLDLDSVYLISGLNKISLKGKKPFKFDHEMYTLTFHKKQIDLYLNTEKVIIKLDLNKNLDLGFFDANNSVFGSPATIAFYEYWKKRYKKFSVKLISLKEELDSLELHHQNSPRIKQIKISIDSIKMGLKEFNIEHILNTRYSSNALDAFVSLTYNEKNLEKCSWVADTLEKRFPKSVYIKEQVDNFRKKVERNNKIAVEGLAPYFKLPDIKKQVYRLSNYLGNYVLLDFWASWCTPCIKEMPKTIEFKKKYADKGLKVITISIDKDKGVWLKAIEKYNMQGLINLHDEKGEAARAYNVSYVPLTVLINPEGKIIGSNIRGEELEKKLERVFSERNK